MTDYSEMIQAINLILKADHAPPLNEDEEDRVFNEFNIGGRRDAGFVAKMIEMERREDV